MNTGTISAAAGRARAIAAPVPRIRLLELLTSFQIGGTERQVANLVRGLDASCFDLHVACLRKIGELLEEIESLPAPLTEFRIGRKLFSLQTIWQAIRLAQYIRKNRIQIVHTFGLYPNIFAAPVAKLAGAATVVASIRDRGDILTPAQRQLQKLACRFADHVLVNADAIREKLVEQGYDPSRIAVIRNGIAPAKLIRAARSGPPLVVVFSRLNPMKGLDYFLDAAAILVQRCPGVRFVIAGDGAIRKDLEERARNLGLEKHVEFTGFRTDIPELLAQASVSVLPSLSEGLSNTLLESMAAGLPVVATDVGGNPEVVEDGVSGLLVPPRNSTALAEAIALLIEDEELASRIGRAGIERVEKLFSVESSVRQTKDFYQQLVEARPR